MITGIGVVDINSLNAVMTSTGSSGFAQVFFTKVAAAGQTIFVPTVTVCALLVRTVSFASSAEVCVLQFVRWFSTSAVYSSGDSSDAFPVWAIFFIGNLIAIALNDVY